MGKPYLSQGNAGQGQGGQAGARQTDSDEQRFRRWVDTPIGSAGMEQVQEPGRGWMLVWSSLVSEPGPWPLCPRTGQSKGARSQAVSR